MMTMVNLISCFSFNQQIRSKTVKDKTFNGLDAPRKTFSFYGRYMMEV
jgi:hypothetical protein